MFFLGFLYLVFSSFVSTEITKRLRNFKFARSRYGCSIAWSISTHVVLLSLYNNYYYYRLAPTKFRPSITRIKEPAIASHFKDKRMMRPPGDLHNIFFITTSFTLNSQFEKATNEFWPNSSPRESKKESPKRFSSRFTMDLLIWSIDEIISWTRVSRHSRRSSVANHWLLLYVIRADSYRYGV